MDIAKMSMNISQANVSQQVSTSVMKMALDDMKNMGNMLNSMMAVSTAMNAVSLDPTVGGSLDISV